MKGLLILAVCVVACAASRYNGNNKRRGYYEEKRYHKEVYHRGNDDHPQNSYQENEHNQDSYQKEVYPKKDYYTKNCYQCAYSPPKSYYDKKVHVEKHQYGGYRRYDDNNYGDEQNKRGYHGGYTRKTYTPVKKTVAGGWDKCLKEIDPYSAKQFGIDVWDCHSNCFTRKDQDGNIFRGCYKGEYNIDPYRLGCTKQGMDTWCFCEGSLCNTIDGRAIPQGYSH